MAQNYEEIIKPFAIYVNDQLHSRFRHYSNAEGVAYAMARQWPNSKIGVYWSVGQVKSMFVEYGSYYAIGVNPRIDAN